MGIQVNPDIGILQVKCDKDIFKNVMSNSTDDKKALVMRNQKLFNEVEEAGCDISYRCVKCRDCKDCKDHSNLESLSLKEEVEQDLINKSVNVEPENKRVIAKLPLLNNPEIALANNKEKALKIYVQQCKKLSRNAKDKDDVIASEKKMQALGFVDYVKNLPHDQQMMLQNSKVHYYIPWRAVWNGNSVSTPCRLVFDASQATSTGLSLNDILPKGKNNMNHLQQIVLHWMCHKVAIHTDIMKMYNTVKLHEDHWCMQRYIWHDELDSQKIPHEKVIKTLIYGVRSSGNQSERALRETARLSQATYPEVFEIISKDVYVDDCLSGEATEDLAFKRADEMEVVLNKGGFKLKGVTFSNHKPEEKLSKDGTTVNVAGMVWEPKGDFLSLDISELNFAKKCRGKKPASCDSKVIPSCLTRRHCVAKVAEIFDITGKVTPIVAAMKLDLRDLVNLQLGWDDTLPDNLRALWKSHFQMMEELPKLKYHRAVIPDDAVDVSINTIDTGDASQSMICIAIYARYKRLDGSFSCQLILGRSKILPDGTTPPRAEMMAATLNAHTGQVVRKALHKYHKEYVKLTDSQIVIHWINSDSKPLKTWVKNRVIEIRRFSPPENWYYVSGENMPADIGTRRGVKISDVDDSSTWINGFPWMTKPRDQLPIKSVSEIILTADEIVISNKERIIQDVYESVHFSFKRNIPDEVKERYQYSNYLIDPNRFRLQKVVRVLSLVIRFINKLKTKIKKSELTIGDTVFAAEQYLFRKATAEVKRFVSESKYINISTERDGILYYAGRILPDAEIEVTASMSSAMLDLSSTTFCVPLVEKFSPLAYSIVNEVHWYHEVAQHRGVETVNRYVLQIAYIFQVRELIKLFRRKCDRCRYLAQKSIEVSMGPISNVNLKIAPPFYCTQVDLCGPFLSYSPHNKRATVKIWLIVYCCTTTSATKIKVMDDYSTSAFVLSFIRLGCDVGYPKYLLPDEGSQLVKGCESMLLNYKDIKNQLFNDVRVTFDVCPVGGHHMHGKVERRIQEVKKSLEVKLSSERLSILEWETLAAQVANSVNDLPLALGNIVGDFEQMDLLTPNRLMLGRNNNRSPTLPLSMSSDPSKFIKLSESIFQSWFECWLISHVPKLMHQPKWFQSDRDIKVGDVVLFLKNEANIKSTYQYGIIHDTVKSTDGKIRKVYVKYRNASEKTDRFTYRAVRRLILIHPVDELSLAEELSLLNAD